MLKKLRRSSHVTLVLAGIAAVSACSSEDEQRRDVYKSREDCLADWANKPEDCKPATEPRHAGGGYWYGPSYRYGGYSSGAAGDRPCLAIAGGWQRLALCGVAAGQDPTI